MTLSRPRSAPPGLRAVRSLSLPVAAALGLGLLGLSASPASAGPPWIAVELPANPHGAATRDALLVVRVYHHDAGARLPVIGRAEGLVDGRRATLPLTLEALDGAKGAYAVRGELPEEGAWVLVIELDDPSGDRTAAALVAMAGPGEVRSVKVPHRRHEGWAVPTGADASEVEALLRWTDRGMRRDVATVPGPWPRGGFIFGLAALILPTAGAFAMRRRRG